MSISCRAETAFASRTQIFVGSRSTLLRLIPGMIHRTLVCIRVLTYLYHVLLSYWSYGKCNLYLCPRCAGCRRCKLALPPRTRSFFSMHCWGAIICRETARRKRWCAQRLILAVNLISHGPESPVKAHGGDIIQVGRKALLCYLRWQSDSFPVEDWPVSDFRIAFYSARENIASAVLSMLLISYSFHFVWLEQGIRWKNRKYVPRWGNRLS